MKTAMTYLMMMLAAALLTGSAAWGADEGGEPLSAEEIEMMDDGAPGPMMPPGGMAGGGRGEGRQRWQRGQEHDMRGPMGFRGRRRGGDEGREGERGRRGQERPGMRMGMGRGEDEGAQEERVEAMMMFLAEHEPSLAAVLKEFQAENPRMFEQRLGGLMRIYGPLMEQMERNPDMAEVGLKRIRLQLRAEQAGRRLQAADAEGKEAARTALRERLGELYEVILRQTEMKLDRMEEQITKMQEWREILEQRGPGTKGGDRDEGDDEWARERAERRSKMGKHGARRLQEMTKRIDEGRKSLRVWRENRTRIIDQRVEQMGSSVKPFPWGGR